MIHALCSFHTLEFQDKFYVQIGRQHKIAPLYVNVPYDLQHLVYSTRSTHVQNKQECTAETQAFWDGTNTMK